MNRFAFLFCGTLCSAALLLAGCTQPKPVIDTVKPSITLKLGVPLKDSEIGVIHLLAEATDNVEVKQVTFFQGERQLSVDTTKPFEAVDSVTASGTYRYRAVARDAAGNEDTALLDVTIELPVGQRSVKGKVVDFSKVDSTGLVTSAWTGGSGSVKAALIGNGNAQPILATANLAADGSFNISLPETLSSTQLTALTPALLGAANCQTPPTFSTSDVKAAVAELSVQAAQTSKTGPIAPVVGRVTLVNGFPKDWYTASGSMVYVTRSLKVTGTVRCTVLNRALDVTFNLDFLPGWNKVAYGVSYNTTGTSNAEVRSVSDLSGAWVYGVNPSEVVRPLPTP